MMQVFRQMLQQLGFVDGKTVRIEFGFADGDMSRIPALGLASCREEGRRDRHGRRQCRDQGSAKPDERHSRL